MKIDNISQKLQRYDPIYKLSEQIYNRLPVKQAYKIGDKISDEFYLSSLGRKNTAKAYINWKAEHIKQHEIEYIVDDCIRLINNSLSIYGKTAENILKHLDEIIDVFQTAESWNQIRERMLKIFQQKIF